MTKTLKCKSGSGIFVFLLLLTLFLSSCGSMAIDKNQSDMMPKAVAMSIFEKYGFKEWVKNPFMSLRGSTERQYIQFNQIERALYSRSFNRLELIQSSGQKKLFLEQVLTVMFTNITEQQAIELTNALRALGATKIDQLELLGI